MKRIKIIFPLSGGRTGVSMLNWMEGRTLRSYFKDPLLKHYHLISKRRKLTLVNQDNQRLRLTSVPKPGDTILLTRA